jgi:hypothetical protein
MQLFDFSSSLRANVLTDCTSFGNYSINEKWRSPGLYIPLSAELYEISNTEQNHMWRELAIF